MRLQEFLDKFTGCSFLLTVNGLCDELPFDDYSRRRSPGKFMDREVLHVAVLTTNGMPELYITVEE